MRILTRIPAALGGLLALGAVTAADAAPLPADGLAAAPAAIVRVQQSASGTATVKTTFANLRAEPTTKSAKVAKVPKGAKLQVLGVKGDWLQVKSGNTTGFIASKLVSR